MKITKSTIPSDSLTNNYLPANYKDAFSCLFAYDQELNADDLQVAFWTKHPAWIGYLYAVRNGVVKIFGLKTDKGEGLRVESCVREGKCSANFCVDAKAPKETVVKLSDKHLDAYMSIYLEKLEEHQKIITVITVVDIHNWLGYIYFYAICPFHKLVVKGMMKYVLKDLLNS